MHLFRSATNWECFLLTTGLLMTVSAGSLHGQTASAPAAPVGAPSESPNWTAKDDHKNMMEQLGIKRLRPGPSGQSGATNSANCDPAKANPFPNLLDPLTLKDGRKVATAELWWKERRPEIVEDFEREVFGRVPKTVPKVTWSITNHAMDRVVGSIPVNARQLIGKADNSTFSSIEMHIQMTLVTPLNAKQPVPLLMMFGGFGGGGFPRRAGEPEPTNRFRGFGNVTFADPPSTEQLIAAGWGYATISPGSIQPDNGASLTQEIIGLVNKGQPRKPDDWGALRAWAWGAACGLDYLVTDPIVNARKVGIEGVSRYGKAALLTLAFEPRFAVALVASSGEGGAKLHRRNFGEAAENLTGSGQYHWMAGNFLKYGTAESSFGSKNAGDIPVDAHQLIALCAPRPTFISYGIPEKGDANWLDQQGSYMATVAAGPVFRPLGARHRRDGGLSHRAKAAGQRRPAWWRTCLASARRRTRKPLEHETFPRVGEQTPPAHASTQRIGDLISRDALATTFRRICNERLHCHFSVTRHAPPMQPKTEEFLNLLLWSADLLARPTFRNLTDSYESWAYRNGLLRQAVTLERQQLLERDANSPEDRLYRLTPQGRLHVLGGRDPEQRWARQWDGQWRLVLFDVPTGQNAQRERLRRYLRDKGFGHLQNSVWITPDPLAEERQILGGGKINVESLLLLEARPCAGESDAEIVAGAWDFVRINRRYARHLKVLEERPGGALRNDAAAKALLRWAAAERETWLDAVTNDPLLPGRILPSDYLGQQAWRRRVEVLRDASRQLRTFNRA